MCIRDSKHVSRVALCSEIVCTKFKLSQAIRLWNVTIFDVNTSYYAMTLTFDPVTFDLWPWTFVVYRLCHGQTLYQIWAQSSNPWWSYCVLNSWPYDLETVSRVALCSEIVYTKFKLGQAIRLWNVTIFNANTSCHAMTLTFNRWPCHLESLWRI